MNKLYRYYLDCGRMGEVESLFIATEEEIKKNIGKTVFFGEILGKHSEICAPLSEDDLQVISEDQEKISWLQGLVSCETISGYNPLDYVEEEY